MDENSQHVGREYVDCEHFRDAILGLGPPALSVADPSVVDHRIEAAEAIDFIGHLARSAHACEVASNDRKCLRQLPAPVFAARGVPAMQNHLMALIDEKLPCHVRPRPVEEPVMKTLAMVSPDWRSELNVSS